MILLKVLARYVDFDHETVEIRLTQDERQNRLQADIPIKTVTDRRRRRVGSS